MVDSYSIHEAARAAGMPARRIAGWVERRVIVPAVPGDGKGSRRRFSREDVVLITLVAEIQGLFGADFRPGVITANPLVWPQVDAAIRVAIRQSGNARQPRLLLYVYRGADHRPKIGATQKGLDVILKAAPVVLVLDPSEVWRRCQPRLEQR